MVGIQIDSVRYQNMRKITAYFMVKQGQNALFCVGKEGILSLVLLVVVAVLFYNVLSLFAEDSLSST